MGHKVGQWVRAGAWFAIAGQVVFVVAWVTAGALQPGYSSIDNYVSELAADSAAHPWIVGAAIVVWGLSIAAIGPALLPALRGRPWRTGVAALFVSFIMTEKPKASWREPAAYVIEHTRCDRREILVYDRNLPPWFSTTVKQIASPIPIPPDFVVKNGSNMRSRSSTGIPGPES